MALKLLPKYLFSKNNFLMNPLLSTHKISSNKISSANNTVDDPRKVVFISQSTDIYENLALEDWLYQNWDFRKRYVLLLWRNSPCVVIGRHQNPCMEANLPYLESAGVPVVRRNSGGGTVYHDSGNLNCTFFTPRESYNRKGNLELICQALKQDFNFDGSVNKKDDIVTQNNLKISGTAAKLGRLAAYHHCTVLVSTDESQMNLALQGDKSLKSKATGSVPSQIANIKDSCPDANVERMLASIGRHYLETGLSHGDKEDPLKNYRRSDGFTLINPSEEWFPGLEELKEKLKSWVWFHGMTPLFEITRPVPLEISLNEGSSTLVSIEVYHGLIKNVKVRSSVSGPLKDLVENHVGKSMVGNRFTPEVFHEIESRLLIEKTLRTSSL